MQANDNGIKTILARNEIFILLVVSLIFIGLVWFCFGVLGLCIYVIQAIWAVLLLEATNYVEHYGLSREKINSGKYEPVSYKHSWNSNHVISNWILFHLPWHSDHHKFMSKSFDKLKPIHNAPQMPLGYPAMIVLAFFPFLFIPLMEKKIQLYENGKHYFDLDETSTE